DERQGRRDNDSREVAQEALAAKLERHRNFLEADLERHPARTHARLRATVEACRSNGYGSGKG
ncbi:MAG: hypothetical protein AAGE01_24710, partial [Pseudomonadota bacterium]